MKYFQILAIAFLSFMVVSCSKTMKVDDVVFNVTTSSSTYQVGDTVHFNFEGNPDIISFYSGEPGNNYEFRDRVLAEGTPQMQFKSREQWGSQKNTMHLLVSKDFTGNYTEEDINAATWTDITEDATLSTGGNGTPSGIIDLSKYVDPGTTFYFAFRFTGTTGSTQRTWTITDFQIDLLMKNGVTTSVADMVSAEWIPVKIEGQESWKVASDKLTIKGGKASWPDNDNWLITKALNPNKVEPDRAVPIKDISQVMDGFDYVYTEKGDYKVVFKAVNATGDEVSSVMKTVNITVE